MGLCEVDTAAVIKNPGVFDEVLDGTIRLITRTVKRDIRIRSVLFGALSTTPG